jgi:CBS domain-containing protein
MSKISHILLRNPVVVPTGTKLREAAQLMKKSKVTSILISKNDKLAGIVSVEDIIESMTETADMNIAVDELMHSPELTIDSEKWLLDAITMFERCKASHITVVEHGEKVGIIRADDLLHTYRFKEGSYDIKDIQP